MMHAFALTLTWFKSFKLHLIRISTDRTIQTGPLMPKL